jgi:PAS domain S-box-containing protein
MFGYTAAQVVGRHGEIIVPPEVRSGADATWRALMAQRGGGHSINENVTSSGERIICEWNNTPLLDETGAVIGVSSFVQDVTERVMSERRQALMLQELDHRVKNNMAAVISLAEQTGRSVADLDEFQSVFGGRVRALARMHTVLAASRWRGAEIRDLIRLIVGPYSGTDSVHLDAHGPPVSLSPRVAQSLAMSFNELATNAVKYGALSIPGGRIQIRWKLDSVVEGQPGLLHVEWIERGGPVVTPPQRRGLGLDLIEGAIGFQLGGRIGFRFLPDGLECSMRLPAIVEESTHGPNPARNSHSR